MDARLLAQGLAVGRAAFGAAMLAVPGRVTSGWVGPESDRPDFAPVVRGFAARDVVLGAGVLYALRGPGRDVRPWLVGAAVGDLTDLVVGVAAHRHLPRTGVVAVGAMAGGAFAVGAWLSVQDW